MKLLILIVAMLTGCGAVPAKPEKVMVPVIVSSIKELPQRPSATFGTGNWPGDKAAAQAALIDAALWQGYATKLEVVVAGCR